ncbi:MAG TPA: hypothetical protein VFO76_01435, partial [Candidatus Kapabacteria bacterium]|nr:hypothetical protein [Candidatus Kapabacteria bacterium]
MKKSFIFLSLFLLSVFANNAFAQVSFTCPLSNQIPPFGIPWTDAGCVDVPIPGGSGTGCVVNVCLCERTLADGTIEFSIKSIWPKFPGSNCNGISWQFIIETAINAVPTNV